jgi:hypothetical protein
MKKFKIINMPQDIEGCHDLINILIEELNGEECSIPSATDTKYSQNFTEFSENNRGLNGGVEFMGFGIGRPPSAYSERTCEVIRGRTPN